MLIVCSDWVEANSGGKLNTSFDLKPDNASSQTSTAFKLNQGELNLDLSTTLGHRHIGLSLVCVNLITIAGGSLDHHIS